MYVKILSLGENMKNDMAKITIEGTDSINGKTISHFAEEIEFVPEWKDDVKINHKSINQENVSAQQNEKYEPVYKKNNDEIVEVGQSSPPPQDAKVVEKYYKMHNGKLEEAGEVIMPNQNAPMATTESWEYVNGKCVGHSIQQAKKVVWKKETDDPIYQSLMKNISIGGMHHSYLNTNEIQDKEYEYIKICKFLTMFAKDYTKKHGLDTDDVKIQFINYGKTELVYVLTEKSGERVTLLVKQPAIAFGKVFQEGKNLTKLQKVDKNVIAPIDYFAYGELELFVTPYINQARCVASDGGCWGIYVPEPYYRFDTFTKEQSDIVTTCMIAKLVSLYDFKNQEGISACKLGGGDFMLPKGWEKETPTIQNTLKNLYLIAAREKVSLPFEEYLNLIRKEFAIPTIHLNQDTLTLNHRARAKISKENIENGIACGKQLIAGRTKSVNENEEVKNKVF